MAAETFPLRSIDKRKGEMFMKTTNWKTWAKAALIRAIRTFAEAMLAYIGTGALVLGDVNWLAALSAGGFGFITAVLLALTGLPEAEQE
ncbi:MAG: holin [Clostridia bacterium]